MPRMVKCDICGQISCDSYLNAHKRLSHRKPEPAVSGAQAEPETVKAIFALYGQLSDESQKLIRDFLVEHSVNVRQTSSEAPQGEPRREERVQ
jgi:hypothetical protein